MPRYRVLVPDQRGYGRSSVPAAIDDYDIMHLTSDLLGLLDDVGARSATFVGHDWGAIVVWQMSVLHPERVDGVVGVSVPFQRRGPSPPIARMRSRFAGVFFYMLYFQEPGVADAELGADPVPHDARALLCGSAPAGPRRRRSPRLPTTGAASSSGSPTPASCHRGSPTTRSGSTPTRSRATGYTGPLNWYRNIDRNWELTRTSTVPGRGSRIVPRRWQRPGPRRDVAEQ